MLSPGDPAPWPLGSASTMSSLRNFWATDCLLGSMHQIQGDASTTGEVSHALPSLPHTPAISQPFLPLAQTPWWSLVHALHI